MRLTVPLGAMAGRMAIRTRHRGMGFPGDCFDFVRELGQRQIDPLSAALPCPKHSDTGV